MVDHSPQSRCNGFTILEVILVLVLISIFAAIAVTRQPSTNVTLKSQKTALQSHIRYAHMRALNNNDAWGIVFNLDQHSYALFKDSAETKRLLPGEELVDVDLEDTGIAIFEGTESSANTSFYFDDWGRPANSSGLLLSELNIQLTNDGRSDNLAITPDTGFVK